MNNERSAQPVDDMSSTAENTQENMVARHRSWLVRLVASRMGSASLVEDVLQEISLAVARSSTLPEQESQVAPWLCTIAIRQCALAHRKAIRQRRLIDGAAATVGDSDTWLDDPIYWLLDRERSGLVREALKLLDANGRSLLISKYVHGNTYPQMAADLGVEPHVVEYQVATARKNLRTLLIERGLGKDDLK